MIYVLSVQLSYADNPKYTLYLAQRVEINGKSQVFIVSYSHLNYPRLNFGNGIF